VLRGRSSCLDLVSTVICDVPPFCVTTELTGSALPPCATPVDFGSNCKSRTSPGCPCALASTRKLLLGCGEVAACICGAAGWRISCAGFEAGTCDGPAWVGCICVGTWICWAADCLACTGVWTWLCVRTTSVRCADAGTWVCGTATRPACDDVLEVSTCRVRDLAGSSCAAAVKAFVSSTREPADVWTVMSGPDF